MDKKAGYKECQRCGLRNKPSALQCDFCGLRFTAGEDWDDNIQALERIGASEEKVLVDEDVSKRIESTIVKRDKIVAGTTQKEPDRSEFDYFRKDPSPAVAIPEPTISPPAPIPIVKPQPVPSAPISEPVKPSLPAEVRVEPQAQERIVIPDVPIQPVKAKEVKEAKVSRFATRMGSGIARGPVQKKKGTMTAVLMIGAILYIAAIILTDMKSIGRTSGWAIVAIASLLLVVSAGDLFISKTLHKAEQKIEPQDVLICPKCHELVTVDDKCCPDCGAMFVRV